MKLEVKIKSWRILKFEIELKSRGQNLPCCWASRCYSWRIDWKYNHLSPAMVGAWLAIELHLHLESTVSNATTLVYQLYLTD